MPTTAARCDRCGNLFHGWGRYCRRCTEEMAELRASEKEREERRERQEREDAVREEAEQQMDFERKKAKLSARLLELDRLAERRNLRRVNIHLPSGSLSVPFDLLSLMPFGKEAIKLRSSIVGSFKILRNDERLVDLNKEYGLQIEKEYTISELQESLRKPIPKDSRWDNYVLVDAEGEPCFLLRSAVRQASSSSTYEGKRVSLENSAISVVLYVRETPEEGKMLGRLLKAIDAWFDLSAEIKRRAEEYTKALEEGKREIRMSVVIGPATPPVWLLGGVAGGLICLFWPISLGVKLLVVCGIIVVAVLLQARLKEVLRKQFEKERREKVETLRSDLAKQILMGPSASSATAIDEP